jgi:hypothetical protein
MAIPRLDKNGLLPEGIHTCPIEELRGRFGCFQGSDQRPRLMRQLEAYVLEVRASRIVRAVLINGSFVTSKPAPNDIDLVLVLPPGHDFKADLGPAQYMVVDSRRVRRAYGLDVLIAEEGSAEYAALVRLFGRVRLQPGQAKGILKLEL